MDWFTDVFIASALAGMLAWLVLERGEAALALPYPWLPRAAPYAAIFAPLAVAIGVRLGRFQRARCGTDCAVITGGFAAGVLTFAGAVMAAPPLATALLGVSVAALWIAVRPLAEWGRTGRLSPGQSAVALVRLAALIALGLAFRVGLAAAEATEPWVLAASVTLAYATAVAAGITLAPPVFARLRAGVRLGAPRRTSRAAGAARSVTAP